MRHVIRYMFVIVVNLIFLIEAKILIFFFLRSTGNSDFRV